MSEGSRSPIRHHFLSLWSAPLCRPYAEASASLSGPLSVVGNSAEMVLTAEQQSKIAKVYEHAAADMRVPPQHRAAFARKASWFRMLAQLKAEREKAAAILKEERSKGFVLPSQKNGCRAIGRRSGRGLKLVHSGWQRREQSAVRAPARSRRVWFALFALHD